jgi:23S rRNA pseudouridine2605 synthase
LNQYLARAGFGSRRACEELILEGAVTINGHRLRELATRVGADDNVLVHGKPVKMPLPLVAILHKPAGYLCTNHDPGRRPLAIDLVPEVIQRVYTVGRLDEDSEGLLLLTNDGELAHTLMHPRFGIEKTYHALVAGSPTREDLDRLRKGIWLSVGHAKAVRVYKLKQQGNSTWLEVVLAEGKNREIRRMLAQLDHKVMRLIRKAIGPIEMGKLKSGQARALTKPEIGRLRRAAERAAAPEIPEA